MESTTELKMGAGAHTPAPQPWVWNASTALYCAHYIRHVQGSFCYAQM